MHDTVAGSAVSIRGNLAVVTFRRYGLEEFGLFMRVKTLPESQISYDVETDTYEVTTPARFAARLGADYRRPTAGDDLALPSHLFDYQRFVLKKALDAGRFANWMDTGLGKTAVELEWARQVMSITGGRVLILVPTLELITQVCQEATRFYGADMVIEPIPTRERLVSWCQGPGQAVGIATYAKLIPGIINEFRHLGGLIADESSILKSGGGVIKWNLIKSARGIEYKLSCTATPAPNDTMEYASQASFLERLRTEGEILWTFFTRDKFGNWSVKPHAREAFYRFMASWSVYLRNPVSFGFADILSSLPPAEEFEHTVEILPGQREMMYGLLTKAGKGLFSDDRLGVQERSRLSQLAKGFLYEPGSASKRAARYESRKPPLVADLAVEEVRAGRQTIIWTVFDAEGDIIKEHIGGRIEAAILDGSMTDEERADTVARFKAGAIPALISKPQLIGYGMNFQNCRAMVFSGWDDSFERRYQAIRRAYRFGQTETVRVHTPVIPELEGMMLANVKRKGAAFDADTLLQERFYREALESEGEL